MVDGDGKEEKADRLAVKNGKEKKKQAASGEGVREASGLKGSGCLMYVCQDDKPQWSGLGPTSLYLVFSLSWTALSECYDASSLSTATSGYGFESGQLLLLINHLLQVITRPEIDNCSPPNSLIPS